MLQWQASQPFSVVWTERQTVPHATATRMQGDHDQVQGSQTIEYGTMRQNRNDTGIPGRKTARDAFLFISGKVELVMLTLQLPYKPLELLTSVGDMAMIADNEPHAFDVRPFLWEVWRRLSRNAR